MTAQEFVELMQECIENGDIDGDAEVVIAQQPSYPLLSDVVGVYYNPENEDGRVQIVAGTATEYGDKIAWEEYIR